VQVINLGTLPKIRGHGLLCDSINAVHGARFDRGFNDLKLGVAFGMDVGILEVSLSLHICHLYFMPPLQL